MGELEAADNYITLVRAAELSGLSVETLRKVAKQRNGTPARLRVARLGPRTVLTTRRWLHEYLADRDETRGQVLPLPAGYVPPEGSGT